MSKGVKKFDFSGAPSGCDIELNFVAVKVSESLIHSCVVSIMHNNRQWSACTRERSEVNHSGQKPHAQKGTGRARQGFLGAPQYKGGGVVFGPAPKFGVRKSVNKKQRRLASIALLQDKVSGGHVIVVDDPELDKPSTKSVVKFLKNSGCDGSIMFVLDESQSPKCDCFKKSLRNIPKVYFCLSKDINAYALIKSRWIVVSASALNNFVNLMGGEVVNSNV